MISAVIPLYNKEKSVERSVNSILAQTYSDFELIIVNDGSTDHSLDVVKRISDSRIRIVTQENQGISAARNRGVTEAHSDWIAFLDADDEWMSDFLANICDLRSSYPTCGLAATGFLRKSATGFDYYQYNKIKYPNGWKGVINYYTVLRESDPFCASSVAVRKGDLVKAGGFPVHVTRGQDIDTWLRLYQVTSFAYYKYAGAVYHLDAENRVHKPFFKVISTPSDYSIGDLLRKILKNRINSKEQVLQIVELLAMYEIPVVRKLVQNGYRWNALKRLWSLRRTRIYRKRAIKMLLVCILPIRICKYLGLLPKTLEL